MKPLVIVRPDRLGDVVVSSAVLRPLLQRYGKDREIIWSVKDEYALLFAHLEGITTVPLEQLKDTLAKKVAGDVVFLNPEPKLEAVFKANHKIHGWNHDLPDDRKLCEIPEAQECAKLLAASGFPIDVPQMP